MTRVRMLMIILGMLSTVACREDNPYWDSSNWDMEATARHMAVLVDEQNSIIVQVDNGAPLAEPLQARLWALLLDEYDIGFEIWVRLRRTRKLVPVFCETLSEHLATAMSERSSLLDRQGSDVLRILRSSAPNEQAWEELRPRLAGFGAAALLDRCADPKGYRQREWP